MSIIGLSAYGLMKISEITKTIVGGSALLNEFDSDNLEGKELKPFALPHGQCKASFPGIPRIAPVSQQLFLASLQSGDLRVIADPKLAYYLAEYNQTSMSLPGSSSFRTSPVIIQGFDLKKSGFPSSGLTTRNNSLAQNANYNSEAIKIQNSLENISRSWLTERGAKVEQNYSIALKGGLFCGREISGRMKDGKNCFRLRFFCNYPRKTIVIIGVIGDLNRVRSADAQRFIDSIDMW